jgi:hypothetical protein
MKDLSTRFWAKVEIPTDPDACWIWIGSLDPNGYGQVMLDGRPRKAHRVSWFLAHGRWPERLALHRCDVRACVKLSHLFEGDQKANMADAAAKGRIVGWPKGHRPSTTKLTQKQIDEIRARYANGERQIDLASDFGVVQSHVSAIVRRKLWP